MSGRDLVAHQDELIRLEQALTAAHDELTEHIDRTLTTVTMHTTLWAPDTRSRSAEMAYQERLRARVDELTAALERVRAALAEVRADAADTEQTNVSVIG